jgi:hypothetical protein
VTDKTIDKSGGKNLRTTCFSTPLELVRDGHNYVGCDGQNYRKSGGKNLRTTCFSTPLELFRDGHNYVGCDRQNYRKSGGKNHGRLAFQPH